MHMFDTGRCYLRAYKESDNDRLLDLWNDPEIQTLVFPEYTVSRLEKFVKETITQWTAVPSFIRIVENKETGEFMGQIGLLMMSPKNRDGRVAITLKKAWWGSGFGTELMQWLVAYGFKERGMHRISLMVLGSNERALAVYKRIGFIEEGRARKWNWEGGRWTDLVSMGILEEEWDIQRGRKREFGLAISASTSTS